jgi:release factor glutamine methyltransferase
VSTISPPTRGEAARGAGEGALLAADARPRTQPSPQPSLRGKGNLVRGAWRTLLRCKLALVDRRRYESLVIERVDGFPLVVLPDVFNPKLLRSGEFLVQQLSRPDLLPPGARVLDLGSGSGAAAVAAARRGCLVVAVDINPSAVRCTRINALLNDVDIDVRQGDLFSPVAERFDVVLFNPPYYRGVPRDALDHAWRSTDIPERFAAQLRAHLDSRGHALLVLSSDGESETFLSALERNRFAHDIVATRDFTNEVMRVHQVRPC